MISDLTYYTTTHCTAVSTIALSVVTSAMGSSRLLLSHIRCLSVSPIGWSQSQPHCKKLPAQELSVNLRGDKRPFGHPDATLATLKTPTGLLRCVPKLIKPNSTYILL
jgi:hypothetical protein